jgi:hypothetical protein
MGSHASTEACGHIGGWWVGLAVPFPLHVHPAGHPETAHPAASPPPPPPAPCGWLQTSSVTSWRRAALGRRWAMMSSCCRCVCNPLCTTGQRWLSQLCGTLQRCACPTTHPPCCPAQCPPTLPLPPSLPPPPPGLPAGRAAPAGRLPRGRSAHRPHPGGPQTRPVRPAPRQAHPRQPAARAAHWRGGGHGPHPDCRRARWAGGCAAGSWLPGCVAAWGAWGSACVGWEGAAWRVGARLGRPASWLGAPDAVS